MPPEPDMQEPALQLDRHDIPDRHSALTELLAQVSIEALQGENLEAVLQRIVDCVTRRLPVTLASIILLNSSCTHFVQEVWSGRIELELPGAMPWPVTLGAAGRCARTGESQLIPDVSADPNYVAGNHGVACEYLVPIRHRGRLHGVLNMESTRVGFFTPEVCTVIDAVAVQVAGAIHLARVVGELELANRKLQRLTMIDGLTGIANRRCFDQRLAQEWERHLGNGKFLSLMLADVDCFKLLNDSCGHLHGDECLRKLANLCADLLTDDEELVARFGGEEFALLLPACGLQRARRMAVDLRQRVEHAAMRHTTSPVAPHITLSLGVATIRPGPSALPTSLIDSADRALYKAKAQGRNCVVAMTARPERQAWLPPRPD